MALRKTRLGEEVPVAGDSDPSEERLQSLGPEEDGKEKEVTFLEFGTRPHVIEPKDKEVLKFEVDGETIFAMRVFHPGTKPLGFVRLTQDDLDKSAKEIAEKLLNNIRHVWA